LGQKDCSISGFTYIQLAFLRSLEDFNYAAVNK